MISYGDSGSGIVDNETVMNPFVETDAEPPDDQVYRHKKIAELKAEICEQRININWVRFCRIYLRLSEEEINHVKERYMSPHEMYENLKKIFIKDYQKFKNLLDQYGIEISDASKMNSECGFEAEDIYSLMNRVPLKERYNFVCHTLKNKEIHPTPLHDSKFPRKVMEAMLECYCERENTSYDGLLEVKDVAEKKGFLKPKKNAMPDKLQKLVDETEDKEESEEERIEEVFQKEIIKALPGITEFKKFARLSSGLDLDELVIHDTIENYKEDVEKQKFKFLTTWKERNGKQATNSNTRKLVANYQMGYEELKTNTGTPETSKDNTSTSDQEIFPTSDVIQAAKIYNAISQTKKKKWQKLAQSQPDMLEEWGAVGHHLKRQMLRYWGQTRENKDSASVTIVKLKEEFMQKKTKKGIFRNRDFDFVCDVIAKSIKDQDWLKFARVKLELRDEDIKRLRRKYAVLTQEQKYQLLKNN